MTLRLNDTPERDQGKRPERGGDNRGGNQNRARREGGNQARGNQARGRGNDPRRRESNPPSGSMADALRKAGFGK